MWLRDCWSDPYIHHIHVMFIWYCLVHEVYDARTCFTIKLKNHKLNLHDITEFYFNFFQHISPAQHDKMLYDSVTEIITVNTNCNVFQARIMATIGVTRGLGDHDLYVFDSNIWIKPFLSCKPEVEYYFYIIISLFRC